MVDVTPGDLRSATELGRSALDARSADDVSALLRRVRHLVGCDSALLHHIRPSGITEWCEPRPAPVAGPFRMVGSDAIGDSVVNATLRRAHGPFTPRDHQLLDLLRPYLASAVVAVGHGEPVEVTVAGHVELTSREAQVLSLIIDGATNKEVGRQLGISSRTVQKHLEHVYDKLGTHRRTAAASWFTNQLAGH